MNLIKICSAAVLCSLLSGCIVVNIQTGLHDDELGQGKHQEKKIMSKVQIMKDMDMDCQECEKGEKDGAEKKADGKHEIKVIVGQPIEGKK